MKNKIFVAKNEVEEFVYNLWKTEFFKKLQEKNGSVVQLLVKELKEKPFSMYEYTNKIERNHMTPWFYHVGIRSYDNPYIHDLYYFHEFYHLISFSKDKHTNFNSFKNSMWENELKASLMSEVFIYYFEPELRSLTFNNRIWFDDLIVMFNKEHIKVNSKIFNYEELPETLKLIKERRVKLREGLYTDLETELWVKKYNNKDVWFETWRNDFLNLEEIRNKYEKEIKINEHIAIYNLENSLLNHTYDNSRLGRSWAA